MAVIVHDYIHKDRVDETDENEIAKTETREEGTTLERFEKMFCITYN